jgi:hypothetical protein
VGGGIGAIWEELVSLLKTEGRRVKVGVEVIYGDAGKLSSFQLGWRLPVSSVQVQIGSKRIDKRIQSKAGRKKR